MHQIVIDTKRCRGLHLCAACESIKPGLVKYCEQHHRLLVSWPSTSRYADTISRLIASCPDRAIVIKPLS